jgi:hypothetical protein
MSGDLRLSAELRLNPELSLAAAESLAAEIVHEVASGAEWVRHETFSEDGGALIIIESSRAWVGTDSPLPPTRIEAFVVEDAA